MKLNKEDLRSIAELATPVSNTSVDLKQFFLRVYQWVDILLEDHRKIVEIPSKYGINHLPGIVSASKQSVKLYQAGLVLEVLNKLREDHGEYEFSIPAIEDDESFKKFFGLKTKTRYKEIGTRQFLATSTVVGDEECSVEFERYATIGQYLDDLSVLFANLIDLLSVKHVTADEIWKATYVITSILDRCYTVYFFLPKQNEIPYVPFKFDAPTDITR